MAISKLTKLANEYSAQDMQIMSRDSMAWLKKKMLEIRSPSTVASTMAREKFRQETQPSPGKLYCFYYDPKGKANLPYYDIFPLVLILEGYSDGFLGLNLHYLPFNYRVAFLRKLMDYASLDKNDDVKRLRVTYDILSASRRLKEFRPCVKRYLYGHLQSKLLAIQPNEWEIATFLPLQHFVKASSGEVWQESLEEIRK